METELKSERQKALEKMNARKERKKIEETTLSNCKKVVRKAKYASLLSEQTNEPFENVFKKLSSGKREVITTGYKIINGVEYCDPMEIKIEEAVKRHGNDPNTRLDECGFPMDRQDRNFTLNHNFENLNKALEDIQYNWIYLYGDPGRGKTSFATRIVWELIKDNPLERATFLSVGKWTDSLKVGKEEYLSLEKLRRIVLVDDFDKFDKNKEFQVRQLLLLVEELKNRHLVIITSNFSRDQIKTANRSSLDLEVMMDRIAGKSIDYPKYTGKSLRRQNV